MKSLLLIATTLLISSARAQFEAGHVKILEDQRYQEGPVFGNFRHQEDGIKYKEETNSEGIRTGFWEYPDDTGKLQRVEFEAGPGIGFRIISSNHVAPTPIHKKSPSPAPQQHRAPAPIQHRAPAFRPQPQHQPLPFQPRPQHQPQPQLARIPLVQQQARPIPVQQPRPVQQPEPVNLFDYPADLQFFRDADGHRFKFRAI